MSAEEKTAGPAPPDVRVRAVVLTMAGILLALAAIGFGLQLLFANRIGTTFVERRAFPAPGVRPDERAQRLTLQAAQRAVLAGGGGRMSIEDAMQAIAGKGPRAFDPIDAPP